jgi:hypothetical protein
MYEFLPWLGLGILLFFWFPIPLTQKMLLIISCWAVRLAILGLLGFGVYLWFRPAELPGGVSRLFNDFPGLLTLVPPLSSRSFGLCLACWLAALLIPLLAVLDTSLRFYRSRERVNVMEMREVSLPTAEPVEEMGVPVLRPIERRTAAAALIAAGSRTTR